LADIHKEVFRKNTLYHNVATKFHYATMYAHRPPNMNSNQLEATPFAATPQQVDFSPYIMYIGFIETKFLVLPCFAAPTWALSSHPKLGRFDRMKQ
jgi:hypothetical protein